MPLQYPDGFSRELSDCHKHRVLGQVPKCIGMGPDKSDVRVPLCGLYRLFMIDRKNRQTEFIILCILFDNTFD